MGERSRDLENLPRVNLDTTLIHFCLDLELQVPTRLIRDLERVFILGGSTTYPNGSSTLLLLKCPPFKIQR